MSHMVGFLLTRNEGERKFSINQNLTVLLVFRKTLRIMIEAKRYKCVRLVVGGI